MVRLLTARSRGQPVMLLDHMAMKEQSRYTEFVTEGGQPSPALVELATTAEAELFAAAAATDAETKDEDKEGEGDASEAAAADAKSATANAAAPTVPSLPLTPQQLLARELGIIKQMVVQWYQRLKNIFRNYAQEDYTESAFSAAHSDTMVRLQERC